MSLVITQAGRTDSTRGWSRADLSRRNIFIWGVIILLSNDILSTVKGMVPISFAQLVSILQSVGIFQYLAWYVILRLLGSSDPIPVARWRDFLITAALCLLVFLPTSRMIWVAATGLAVYLWIFNLRDLKVRSAGIVLAALSLQQLWGHIFFDLVAMPLLRAETGVLGTILELSRAGTVWHDNLIIGPSGHGIVMYPGCSSFHNLSLALLCWVTLTRLRHQNWRRRDLVPGGVIVGTMILLNLARLYLMALDTDAYHYWHDGLGAEIFGVGASVTILLLGLWGARAAKEQV